MINSAALLLVWWMTNSLVDSLTFVHQPFSPYFHIYSRHHHRRRHDQNYKRCYHKEWTTPSFSIFSSTSESTEDEEEAAAGELLLDWMEDSSSESFVGPVEIKKSTFGHGLGLFVTEDVEGDLVLLEIPREKCIELDANDDNNDGSGGGGVWDNRNKLAEKLSLKYLKTILHDRVTKDECNDAPSSEFEPYLRLLPFQHDNQQQQQQHVLKWSDEEVEELFQGSIAYDEVCSLRNEVEQAIHALHPQLRSKLNEIRSSCTATAVASPHDLSTSSNNLISDNEINNAITSSFISILSRSFEDDETNGSKLIPVLDMCNHASFGDENIMHGTDADDGTVVVYTKMRLKAGTELCYTYYDVETKKEGENDIDVNLHRDDDINDGATNNEYEQELARGEPTTTTTTTTLEPYQIFILYGFIPDDVWRENDQEQQLISGDVRDLLRSKSTIFFPNTD